MRVIASKMEWLGVVGNASSTSRRWTTCEGTDPGRRNQARVRARWRGSRGRFRSNPVLGSTLRPHDEVRDIQFGFPSLGSVRVEFELRDERVDDRPVGTGTGSNTSARISPSDSTRRRSPIACNSDIDPTTTDRDRRIGRHAASEELLHLLSVAVVGAAESPTPFGWIFSSAKSCGTTQRPARLHADVERKDHPVADADACGEGVIPATNLNFAEHGHARSQSTFQPEQYMIGAGSTRRSDRSQT